MKLNRILFLVAVTFLTVIGHGGQASTPQSANVLKFAGPDHTLFIGDSKSATIYAYPVMAKSKPSGTAGYNLVNFDERLSKYLKSPSSRYLVRDFAIHPVSKDAYLSVDVNTGTAYKSIILVIDLNGEISTFDKNSKHTEFSVSNAPDGNYKYWDNTPMRSFTFTDLDLYKGKLYVSGLSNAEFSSTLRVIDYPFTNKSTTTSVEIYHSIHNQRETRAPIQTLDIITVNNVEFILAAYTCTPLVLIPLSDLKDGAHVKGKTIAEMGYGNTPVDLIRFKSEDFNKQPYEGIILLNKNRSAQFLNLEDISRSANKEGLSNFEGFVEKSGTPSITIPLVGLLHLDDHDATHITAIRRNLDNGQLEIVSYIKNLYLRLDEFVVEYDQPGYPYPKEGFQAEVMKPVQNWIIQDINKTKFIKP